MRVLQEQWLTHRTLVSFEVWISPNENEKVRSKHSTNIRFFEDFLRYDLVATSYAIEIFKI